MQPDEIRYLFAYDQWATRRVLKALEGLDADAWTRPNTIEKRGLGQILVHQLGAAQRWRVGIASQGEQEGPLPEDEPLPSVDELIARWEAEWVAVDAWLSTMTDGLLNTVWDGKHGWTMLVHVVNHGTQHRSEAAALLTADSRSPGDLDLIDFADELTGAREPTTPGE